MAVPPVVAQYCRTGCRSLPSRGCPCVCQYSEDHALISAHKKISLFLNSLFVFLLHRFSLSFWLSKSVARVAQVGHGNSKSNIAEVLAAALCKRQPALTVRRVVMCKLLKRHPGGSLVCKISRKQTVQGRVLWSKFARRTRQPWDGSGSHASIGMVLYAPGWFSRTPVVCVSRT